MAELLVQFDEPQCATDGRYFVVQVWGERTTDGIWEAWIEFHPVDGGEPTRTAPETEQLTRGDLRYWAAGLGRSYLQNALDNSLSKQPFHNIYPDLVLLTPETDRAQEHLVLETNAVTVTPPALDPFALYRSSGEYVLRQELRAMDAQQLRDIIAAFAIPDLDATDLARTFEDALAERIVAGVQQSVVSLRDKTVINPPRANQA